MDGLKARLSFDAVAYDYDDEYLTIDTDTHVININNVSRLFGVQYDGNSKLIKFRIRNQLSEIQNMQDSIVYINWIDQKGVKGQSIAIDKTISNDICEFAWKVPFDALKNSGVLHFAMSAVITENNSSVINQKWSTQIASVITPDGIYIKSYTPSSEEEDRIAQIYNELTKMMNKQNDNLQSQVNSLKEDTGNVIVPNVVRHLTENNGSYNHKTGLFTPSVSRPHFCGVKGLHANHKYRVIFAPATDAHGKVSLYILNASNATWYIKDLGGKQSPKANEVMLYDINWTYNENDVLVVNTTENSSQWDKTGFYLCVYDITDLSESQLSLISTLNTKGFVFASTADDILNTKMKPRKIDKNVFDNVLNFPITHNSLQNSQNYIFDVGYINGSKDKLSNKKFILALARINISELAIKDGESSLEGLKYKFVMKLSEYSIVRGSFYNDGVYTLTNIVGVTDDDKNGKNMFIGFSMDENYTKYNSLVSVEDISYIIMTTDEKQKYMENIINAYSEGYDFPMLSLTCVEQYKNSSDEKTSWYEGKKYCAYGDSITQQNYYPYVLKKKLGMSGYNNGVGGRAIYQMARDENINTIQEDSDVIIVMGGTNDWAQNIRLGEIDDATEETFYGALNLIAEKLSKKFPTKIIVFATTPYGLLPKQTGWTDQNGYRNNLGLTTGDYGKCIMNVARKYGFPCADVYGKCGWNKYNITEWINYDGGYLHTKQNGGYRIGEVICGTLIEIEPIS